MNRKNLTKGFTMIELLISIAILVMVSYAISIFQRDVFSLNNTLQGSLNAQLDARAVVYTMVAGLRETTQASTGAYPIALANSSALTFFSPVTPDGAIDQVRYFMNGTSLDEGITEPSGTPLSYNPANEVVTTLIHSVIASSTLPLFQYYPNTYTGTSSPLVSPVDVSQISLVQISVIITSGSSEAPTPIVVTSSVTLRNLKDNL